MPVGSLSVNGQNCRRALLTYTRGLTRQRMPFYAEDHYIQRALIHIDISIKVTFTGC